MSIFAKLLGTEKRSQSVKSSDPYVSEFFGQRSGMGGHVDLNRASGLAVAQACIATISQALASVPLNVYRRSDNGGRERATDHPLFAVLHDQPNDTMTAFEAREFLIASLMTSGNAYARLKTNSNGQVNELYPLDPMAVSVERLSNGRLRYRYTDPKGGVLVLLQDEVLHLRYRLAPDGVMGLSPIRLARETFNLALAQADTVGTMTEKGFRPAGAFVFPEALTDDQYKRFSDASRRSLQGNATAGQAIVLDGGADFKTFSLSGKDAEFLDSRKLSNLDICRIWGVPPTVAGITDNATYSNADQEARALVVRCLAPTARRVEQAMNVALLSARSRQSMFIEHDLAGLLRGDMKARYDAYRTGREWGWLSINEIRGWENMPEVEGGDERLSPLNMAPLGADRSTSDE